MPPRVAVAPPSLFAIVRSGAAVSGVVSVAVLFAGVGSGPFAPSSATDAVLLICATPAGAGLATVTANGAEPVAASARQRADGAGAAWSRRCCSARRSSRCR